MHFLEEMNWEMVQYWVNNALHLLSENCILYKMKLIGLIILFGGRRSD